jgi:hypothetical protein
MECETLLPKLGPLPQISQFDATVNSFKDKCRFKYVLEALLMKAKDYRLDAHLGESTARSGRRSGRAGSVRRE